MSVLRRRRLRDFGGNVRGDQLQAQSPSGDSLRSKQSKPLGGQSGAGGGRPGRRRSRDLHKRDTDIGRVTGAQENRANRPPAELHSFDADRRVTPACRRGNNNIGNQP